MKKCPECVKDVLTCLWIEQLNLANFNFVNYVKLVAINVNSEIVSRIDF